MNWSTTNLQKLTLSLKHDKYNNDINNWQGLKKKILQRDNYTCVYCGGKYQKYMYCVRKDKSSSKDIKNLISCCRLCYICTHFNYLFFEEVVLCRSKMQQVDIIRKTVDYILANNSIPSIIDIDANAEQINMSVYNFINLISLYEIHNISIIKDFKVFFTNNLDRSFIGLKPNTAYDVYIADSDDIDDAKPATLTNDVIESTDFEKELTNKIMCQLDYLKRIAYWDRKIRLYENIIKSSKELIDLTDIEYQMYQNKIST